MVYNKGYIVYKFSWVESIHQDLRGASTREGPSRRGSNGKLAGFGGLETENWTLRMALKSSDLTLITIITGKLEWRGKY